MKKILNGKLYNTETAEYIGAYSNGLSYTDFHYFCETLYQKKNKEFFLYCEGGARSPYASHCGDTTTGGNRFVPLSEDDARKWIEQWLDAEIYIELFGEPEE